MMNESGKLAKPIMLFGAGLLKQVGDDPDKKASEVAIGSAIDTARGSIQKNVPTYADIFIAADNAEKRLESLKIPVADRSGAIVHFRPEGPSAKSYKYAQNTLEMQVERKRDGWVLTHVGRTLVYPQQPETERLFLTPKQREIALERGVKAIEQQFSVQEPSRPKPQPQRVPEQGVGIGG